MPPGHVREREHFERPVTPLFGSLVLPAIDAGYREASLAVGGEPGAMETVVVGSYVYAAWAPLPPPEEPVEPPSLPDLVVRWERDLLPEARRLLEDVERLLRPDVPPRRAAGEWDALQGILARLLRLHYETGFVTRGAVAMLEDALRGRGVEQPSLAVATLLAPEEGLLHDLEAWIARASAAPDPLRAAREDPLWDLARLRPARLDLSEPTWGEDPAPLVRALRTADLAAWEAGQKAALARRAEAERSVLARFPEAAHDSVRMVLDAVRRARAVTQTLNVLAGEAALGAARGACLRAGARLGLGEDVAWLTREEVRAALLGEPLPPGLVAARRKEHAEALARTPPDVVGEPDPSMLADPRARAVLGALASKGAPLSGLGASAGRAEGAAWLVRSDEELDAMPAGAILVVRALEPAWTAAMHRAAGIVAEAGGMLSHAAIVARELGKPAVVGVADATRRLRSGVRVKVDGASGEVVVLEKAA